MTFAPDHDSDYFSDGVRLELFHQEESHFFQILGQAKPHIMYMSGGDDLRSGIESLAVMPASPEETGKNVKIVTRNDFYEIVNIDLLKIEH